jgi:hypothetical protein
MMTTVERKEKKRIQDAKRDWAAVAKVRASYSRERGKRIRDENRKRLSGLKESLPCEDCGQHYKACQMQFDHVRGEKYKNVSSVIGSCGARWETIQAEIDKCELVCANCHALRTWAWQQLANAKGEQWWRNGQTGKLRRPLLKRGHRPAGAPPQEISRTDTGGAAPQRQPRPRQSRPYILSRSMSFI